MCGWFNSSIRWPSWNRSETTEFRLHRRHLIATSSNDCRVTPLLWFPIHLPLYTSPNWPSPEMKNAWFFDRTTQIIRVERWFNMNDCVELLAYPRTIASVYFDLIFLVYWSGWAFQRITTSSSLDSPILLPNMIVFSSTKSCSIETNGDGGGSTWAGGLLGGVSGKCEMGDDGSGSLESPSLFTSSRKSGVHWYHGDESKKEQTSCQYLRGSGWSKRSALNLNKRRECMTFSKRRSPAAHRQGVCMESEGNKRGLDDGDSRNQRTINSYDVEASVSGPRLAAYLNNATELIAAGRFVAWDHLYWTGRGLLNDVVMEFSLVAQTQGEPATWTFITRSLADTREWAVIELITRGEKPTETSHSFHRHFSVGFQLHCDRSEHETRVHFHAAI